MTKEKATFGAGCFWHVEKVFSETMGVIDTSVGYMGGNEQDYPEPSYDQVCSHKTGYAEVVQIIFDTTKTSYKKMLEIFWENHDPTTLNKQGPDVGEQYRSVIFYHTAKQKKEAEESLKQHQKKVEPRKIVTQILKVEKYFKAEDYHQKYYKKNIVRKILRI